MSKQDKLLDIIPKLHKYDIFRRYWNKFILNADSIRTSNLLAVHAKYKIHLKQMGIARHMLLKALNLDKNNEKAKELLQVRIFLILN